MADVRGAELAVGRAGHHVGNFGVGEYTACERREQFESGNDSYGVADFRSEANTMLAGASNPGAWAANPLPIPSSCQALTSAYPVAPGFQPTLLNMVSKFGVVKPSNSDEASGPPLIEQSISANGEGKHVQSTVAAAGSIWRSRGEGRVACAGPGKRQSDYPALLHADRLLPATGRNHLPGPGIIRADRSAYSKADTYHARDMVLVDFRASGQRDGPAGWRTGDARGSQYSKRE